MSEMDVDKQIRQIAEQALAASRQLAAYSTGQKNAALVRIAELLEAPQTQPLLMGANAKDLETGQSLGLSDAMLDRLRLTPERIQGMAEGARQVAALPDPVGKILETRKHQKGFSIEKVRVPIGVIGIIYESRPNVTIDCAVLCLKSGNATILRGGREAFHSNMALAQVIEKAFSETGLPLHAVQLIPTVDRNALNVLLKADDCIHCLIPRGGEGLIRFVAENARMPVIKHYKGVCNVYLDTEIDQKTAVSVTVNAKCQRPSVCNAAENLIVHQDLLQSVFPEVAKVLKNNGVELRVDERAAEALKSFGGNRYTMATEEDYHTEYVDKILSVKTVDSLDEAIQFVNTYGSGHSDAIITTNEAAAAKFQNEVDSATVYWNVSTRFTDGFEFGLGAEIGISTDRLHARGPMGLNELTTYKYLIKGHGEIK
ncbi:glutamate-5-semialdehyde dehydrogenase [Puniceicoccales bacterium CK1056]|uniref:Gamma-glutamyl phosphate reductase n=1 Tax=Oceanipulchritudo coccoides TaxID=2706888 RepID=A0A6B2M0W6_9BACT|nr:glutamate-5-semialdehyde dehydrogenase [Oceanipulchritudo coccoides]NDV61687.1 glutamate-5-semialdehyde dehydrogenase [Oceanipulchritudo coccoides]